MVVGMVTVFIILIAVIYLSKLLIFLVNKYAQDESGKAKAAQKPAKPDNTVEILKEAISIVTGGAGTIIKIEKL